MFKQIGDFMEKIIYQNFNVALRKATASNVSLL